MTLAITPQQAEQLISGYCIVDGPCAGGQKYVYKCQSEEGLCAVKIVCPSSEAVKSCSPEELDLIWGGIKRRSLREYEIMSECQNPHLVKVHQGTFEERQINGVNVAIFVEDWIDGVTLDTLMQQTEKPFSNGFIVNLALDIIDAIEALDLRGYVHRDIKPLNIMRRDEAGDYVLLDLGIALDQNDAYITRTGVVVGTPAYLSPEQMNTRYKPDLNFKSDLFSLGTIMYELATRNRPYYRFGYDLNQLYEAIMEGPAPSSPEIVNPNVDFRLAEVIMRLLAKNPNGRYRKIEHLRTALNEIGE